ncbi:Zinc (Zn2+)-Iron (Fe2+) Permease (ZIP) Family [Pseudoloma neurophilia]|uniref:Zinc (Zn2+)-Iron (Fe2+) Permease (ZIP) Family n=1 Tax=Pseudoloma neurophilia TaxID=146866 RepID=A0A0R0LYD7_9MICR|nr:Zinc (Zn2+)-Iron (Fe2+) Permease (ZIP) Family [Pseudoloma neurophilia]
MSSVSFWNFFFISAATFIFTLVFSFSYVFVKNMKISAYAKCLAGGIILATLLFHVFPDVCISEFRVIGQLFTGISFLLLFAVDKLYLYTECNENDQLPQNVTKKQALVFILALSLHSFLEGLGIPAKTGKSLVWYIIGLFGHKWIEAFALSISVHTSGFEIGYVRLLMTFYSILTPLGTMIGYFIISSMKDNRYFQQLECFLNGIACGSFFYIEFIEMLNGEFVNGHKKQRKLGFIIFGFALMSIASLGVAYAESK